MTTTFCARCETEHPGKACDYDVEKGTCSMNLSGLESALAKVGDTEAANINLCAAMKEIKYVDCDCDPEYSHRCPRCGGTQRTSILAHAGKRKP